MDAGQAKPADAHRMAVHSPVILIKKVGRAGTKKLITKIKCQQLLILSVFTV